MRFRIPKQAGKEDHLLTKNKKRNVLFSLLVLALFILVAAGCSNDSETKDTAVDDPVDNEVIGDIKATISIDFPDNSGQQNVKNITMGLTDDSSVLDLLFSYTNENDLDIEIEGGDENPYVVSIGGITQTDNKGWIFKVNDEMVMEPAGKAKLKTGDKVVWEFADLRGL